MTHDVYDEFTKKLISSLVNTDSDQERVNTVGAILAVYLPMSDFMHSCVDRALLALENGRSRWRNPPIDSDIEAGYVMRMIYWPANYRSDIHRHNLWTVTGVLYNSIEVVTYDELGISELARYKGKVGAVGKVIPPCVHAAENNTDVPSVTLAVFCRQPAKLRSGPEVEWITDTEEAKYSAGAFERALRAFVFMINDAPGPMSLRLLDKIYDLARPSLQLLVIKAIAQLDVGRAIRRLEDLEYLLTDEQQRTHVVEVRRSLEHAITLQA